MSKTGKNGEPFDYERDRRDVARMRAMENFNSPEGIEMIKKGMEWERQQLLAIKAQEAAQTWSSHSNVPQPNANGANWTDHPKVNVTQPTSPKNIVPVR